MRRIFTALLCLLFFLTCYGRKKETCRWKTAIGLDLTYLFSDCGAGIMAGKQFSRHWSIEGYNEVNVRMILKDVNEDEESHYNEFTETAVTIKTENRNLITGGIRMKYWMDEAFNRSFIALGCRYCRQGGVRGTIGAGYAFHIWKGFTGIVSSETEISKEITSGMDRIRISFTLSYIL